MKRLKAKGEGEWQRIGSDSINKLSGHMVETEMVKDRGAWHTTDPGSQGWTQQLNNNSEKAAII